MHLVLFYKTLHCAYVLDRCLEIDHTHDHQGFRVPMHVDGLDHAEWVDSCSAA